MRDIMFQFRSSLAQRNWNVGQPCAMVPRFTYLTFIAVITWINVASGASHHQSHLQPITYIQWTERIVSLCGCFILLSNHHSFNVCRFFSATGNLLFITSFCPHTASMEFHTAYFRIVVKWSVRTPTECLQKKAMMCYVFTYKYKFV